MPVQAQTGGLDEALDRLPSIDEADLPALERRIERLRAQSGSPGRDVLLSRARSAVEAGEFLKAIGDLSALIDHAPDFAEAYYERAGVYFLTNRLGLAVNDLGHALALSPRHYDAVLLLAVIQLELGRHNDALRSLTTLRTIHPRLDGAERVAEELDRQLGRKQL